MCDPVLMWHQYSDHPPARPVEKHDVFWQHQQFCAVSKSHGRWPVSQALQRDQKRNCGLINGDLIRASDNPKHFDSVHSLLLIAASAYAEVVRDLGFA